MHYYREKMEVHLVENEISSKILKLDKLQNDHFMANASAS